MNIENLRLDPTSNITMNSEEMIGLWNELEELTDKGNISNSSSLFKLKLALKNNYFELYKLTKP